MFFSVFGCYSGFHPIYPGVENLDLSLFDCTCYYVGVTLLKRLFFWSKKNKQPCESVAVQYHSEFFFTLNN